MQPDAARVAETREWLVKAALDLRTAEFEFTAQPPLTADIVFRCQQLAEKSLKGFLVWHDVPFRSDSLGMNSMPSVLSEPVSFPR